LQLSHRNPLKVHGHQHQGGDSTNEPSIRSERTRCRLARPAAKPFAGRGCFQLLADWKAALDACGLNYEEVAGQDAKVLVFDITTDDGSWTVVAGVNEEQQYVYCTSRLDAYIVPPDKRLRAAEVLMRLNCYRYAGCYEIDFATGLVYFYMTTFVEEEGVGEDVLTLILATHLNMVGRLLPGFLELLYQDVSPEDAAAKIIAAQSAGSAADE